MATPLLLPAFTLLLLSSAGCAGLPHAPSPSLARRMVVGQSAAPVVDLIIVHGCPARPDGTPSSCNMRRVRAAVRAYGEGRAAHVLFTGGAVLNAYPESRVMAEHARTLGLPEEAILTEEESHHTVTNLSVAKGIMKRRGMKTALLVSESMHLVWAKQLADFYRMKTWLYPADMLPPYTEAYQNLQDWDAWEPWKSQTGVYGKPLVVRHVRPAATARRVAFIVVGDRVASATLPASLADVPGVEVQAFDWVPGRRPAALADDLDLAVQGWTRGFNGPVDEVVVLAVGGASTVTALLARRFDAGALPVRFERVATIGMATASVGAPAVWAAVR